MRHLTYDEYQEHDCSASPEDGCEVCEEWQVQQQVANDIKFDEMKEQQYKRSDFYQGGDKIYNKLVYQQLHDKNRNDLKLFKSHEVQHRLINSLIK